MAQGDSEDPAASEVPHTGSLRPQRVRFRGLGWHVAVVTALAVVVFAAATLAIWAGLGAPSIQLGQPLSANDQFNLIKLALTVVAGAGGVVALVVAYRRQRVIEEENQRAHHAVQRENTKLFTDRFTAATGQLGHERTAVRLAGVYAVASLADDAPTLVLRQTCIDVLCGYLRMPYQHDPEEPGWREGEREVRRAITQITTEHLQRQREVAVPSWHGHRFNFEGAVFDGSLFHFIYLPKGTNLNFLHCRFVAGLNQFQGLELAGGIVNLYEIEVSGGELLFHGVHINDGILSFGRSKFTGGTVKFNSLPREAEAPETDWATTISGGRVEFQNVVFAGSDFRFDEIVVNGGKLQFNGAQFKDGSFTFQQARLKAGLVEFAGTSFTGTNVQADDIDIAPGVLDLGPTESVPAELARFVEPPTTAQQ